MKILITGGAGFIGSALVRYIIEHKDDEVFVVDKLSYAVHPYALSSVNSNSRYQFKRLDICDTEELNAIFTEFQPDVVMHLAAETHVDRSLKRADAFMQSNYMGTFNLLEVSRQYWQQLPKQQQQRFRFLHISTDEVYGELAHPDNDISATQLRFKEDSFLAPSSPYSASKASSDHLVYAWWRSYGLPVVISRSTNNYGPFQFTEKLIPHMVQCALKEEPMTIYGSGRQMRDWLYVDDHVRALYLLLSHGQLGEIYNIGANNEHCNIDVVHAICRILDELRPRTNSASYIQLIEHIADRPGHDVRYAVDCTKLKAATNWTPKHHFEDALSSTVTWLVRDFDAAAKYQA